MLRIIEKSDGNGKAAINPRHVVQVTPNRNGTARIWLTENGAASSLDTKADFDAVVSTLNGEVGG
jgi:hypothetical protein